MEATTTTQKIEFCSSKQKYRIRCLNIFSFEEKVWWLVFVNGTLFILVTTCFFGEGGNYWGTVEKRAFWTIFCFDSGTTNSEQKIWNRFKLRHTSVPKVEFMSRNSDSSIELWLRSCFSHKWCPVDCETFSDFCHLEEKTSLRVHKSGAFLGGVTFSAFYFEKKVFFFKKC